MPARVNTPSDRATLIFITILCVVCGTILAMLATGLKPQQERAQDLDRNKQLLIAARIYDSKGHFLLLEPHGQYVAAKMDARGVLVPGSNAAVEEQIAKVSQSRIKAMLVDAQGAIYTFEQAQVNMVQYLQAHRKTGYANLPLKLIYAVLPNSENYSAEMNPEAYIIPINGRGLWDAVYGYLAIKNDGNQVIGTSWYKHAETPGLGANIAEPSWQEQFLGKVIFQPDNQGHTDFATAPLGITVVKGKVKDILGSSAKGRSAVDGISGSTLTGNGISDAYKASLEPYRAFLLHLYRTQKEKSA